LSSDGRRRAHVKYYYEKNPTQKRRAVNAGKPKTSADFVSFTQAMKQAIENEAYDQLYKLICEKLLATSWSQTMLSLTISSSR